MLKILRILIPIDFSKESDLALEWGAMIAKRTSGATLYLLHVLPPEASGFGTVAYEMELSEIEAKLKAAQEKLPKEILSFTGIEKGNIPAVIAKMASEKDIDLVVMTTRGRQGLKHFLPESATEDTVRVAPCPVLVLHLNRKNQRVSRQSSKAASPVEE